MSRYFKKSAFTLAEVLITLGIIGVVAAITIPSLVQHYKKVQATARLKRFNSIMTQVLFKSQNDNGSIETWFKYGTSNNVDLVPFFKQYMAPYMKYTEYEYKKGSSGGLNGLNVRLDDGSTFYIMKGWCFDINYDINGTKGPNVSGKDKFAFMLCNANGNNYEWILGRNWGPYCHSSRTKTYSQKVSMCKSQPSYCSCLLEYYNWEFTKDYPHRL